MGYALFAVSLALLVFLGWKFLALRKQFKKYQPIADLDDAITKRTSEAENAKSHIEELQATVKRLTREVGVLNDDFDLATAGFYKSRYDFGDSKKYEDQLKNIRDEQKELIKDKRAIICDTTWTVGGSKAEGKKMTNRTIKLGLSAFNVQCDNEILKVKFGSIDRAEEKMRKIRENVDKLLEPNQCRITDNFFKLKLDELFLAYEYQEQLHKEKEEQRQLREQMRDEEKARREMDRAQAEAEREERRYQDALEKARKELDKKSDADRESYMMKIADLEAKLQEAVTNKERAKSQAEMTRRGHVYVISNIGSFGEEVFKIGMTRRLDPMDRVWELGDASVPFDFDVHAMIFSDDAPTLERQLHAAFADRRVNQVNERKEFFRVPLKEIEQACRKHHGTEFKLTLLAEAKEYRQTLAIGRSETDKSNKVA